MCGEQEWSGDHPFEIQVADPKNREIFILKVRKGSENGKGWVNIQYQTALNPNVVISYLLQEKSDGIWDHIDGSMIKHGRPTEPLLSQIYEKLERVKRGTQAGPLEESK